MYKMRRLLELLALFLLTANYEVDGRAVNISNVWILPQEDFPVFYRYFRDGISWYEADAVCQFHHGNLVTVDTTAQYDAVRAYLKELDITNSIWIGLIKNKLDEPLIWTAYRTEAGDGYWQTLPTGGQYPICAVADPASDYRWRSFNCGGPEVASFVCELPVPEWALNRETGCMMHALPALTATYLPGSAAIQLTADCGLAGVKKIMCTGNTSREDLLKDLSCGIPLEEFVEVTTTTLTPHQSTLNNTETSNTSFHKKEIADKIFHLNITSTNLNIPEALPLAKQGTPIINKSQYPNSTTTKLANGNDKTMKKKRRKSIFDILATTEKSRSVATHSNAIVTDKYISYVGRDNESQEVSFTLAYQKYDFPENAKIYTQLSDHFIPPLVMAKSKTSTDMAVVSVDEKHSQKEIIKLKNYENIDNGIMTSAATISTSKYNINNNLFTKNSPSFAYVVKTRETTRSVPSALATMGSIVTEKPRKDKKYNMRHNPKYIYLSKHPSIKKMEENMLKLKFPQIPGDETNLHEEIRKSFLITAPYVPPKKEIFNDDNKKATTTQVPYKDVADVTINPNNTVNDSTEKFLEIVLTNSSTKYNEVSNEINVIDTTESKVATVTADPAENDLLNDTMIDPIPKPNRSRIFTSSSRHTFYPYFINRVLG